MSRIDWIVRNLPQIGLVLLLLLMTRPYGAAEQWIIIVTIVTYFLDWGIHRCWRDWQWSVQRIPFALAILLWLLVPLWILLGIEQSDNNRAAIELFMPFLVLGIVGLTNTRKYRIDWMALALLSAMVLKIGYILGHIDLTHLLDYPNQLQNPFNSYRCYHLDNHMFFNIHANMALVLGYAALRRGSSRCMRWIIGTEMLIVLASLLLTEGRVGYATVLFIVFVVVIQRLWLWRKSVALGAVLILVGTGIVLTIHICSVRAHSVSHDPRRYINNVSLHMLQEHPFRGYGPTTARTEFVQRGLNDEGFVEHYIAPARITHPAFREGDYSSAHPHNSFMQIGLAFGVEGIVLLAALLILFVVLAPPSARTEVFLAVCVYGAQAFFDVIGNNVPPILLMTVMLLLYHISVKPESENREKCEAL